MGLGTDIIMGLLMAVLLSVLVTEVYAAQQAAYGQGSASFDEIDEDHKPLLNEILDSLKNQTPDRINIDENGRMHIVYNNRTQFDVLDDTNISTTHNFTIENGYRYEGNTIYKPDGSELFAE